MFRLVVLTCAIVACTAQNVDPKLAKILKEQRFNAGDGRAGTAYATENGHIFREETDISGNRIGQYSYIGEDGQTYTVRYSAGKDGFRILDGAHIPATGQEAAAFVAEPVEPEIQPQQPIQKTIIAQQPQQPQVVDYEYDDTPVDPNFNPFINPHDPTHRNFQFNANAANFNPAHPLAVQKSLVPDCADCAGVNPFINPFDASHSGHLAGHLAGFQQQAAAPVPRRPAAPRKQALPVAPVQPTLAPRPRIQPTAVPKNFFPPGQLKLNRFETGFNFDFSS